MNAIDFSPYDLRVIELAKKVANLYSPSELEKLAPITPQTIQRWADSKHRPSKSAASTLSQIIAVSENDYKRYLEGDITLDELWTLKGSAKKTTAKQPVTAQTVIADGKRLPTLERLKVISNLVLTLNPKELENNNAKSTLPDLIELSETAKKRLKNLLDMSNVYLQQTYQSIIEAGANKNLIEDMDNGFHNDYVAEVYQTLLPYLCLCTEWRDTVPMNANPAHYFESVQSLVDSLNKS